MATLNDITPPQDVQAFTNLDGATGGEKEGKPYTTFWKLYRNGEAYFAQVFKPRLDIEIGEVREALRRVPDADIYPEIPEGTNLTVVTTIDKPNEELYIKRPSLFTYETSEPLDWTRAIFLGEAEIMEQFSHINHKNIVHYYGSQVREMDVSMG